MSDDESVVTCAVQIDWKNDEGMTLRTLKHKIAILRLVRNEMQEMYVEVTAPKATAVKLHLRGIMLHKKFMSEGKATIVFNPLKCSLMMTNAPPGSLGPFLRTLMVKLVGAAENKGGSNRLGAHILSSRGQLVDVSPVTNAEASRVQSKLAPHRHLVEKDMTPKSKKRKRDEHLSPPPKRFNFEDSGQPLTDEQKTVLQACQAGKCVFFTGSAGTGKSFLLRKIISSFPPDGTTATASTGVAACLIGGVTLHSFAGIGSGEGTLANCYKLSTRSVSASNWRKCKRLIIDEISMVDGEFFEKIEAVARHVRGNDKPFGGIQLVLCGDFLQLPPVNKRSGKRFCFQSEAWNKCIQQSFELTIVHRQKDNKFVKILNHLRIGVVSDDVVSCLKETAKQKIETNGILATQLCSHTHDANLINETKLKALSGDETIFNADDSDATMDLDKLIPTPGKLTLKIGAQVMLLKNISVSDGLVNGARGIVKEFKSGLPVVKFKNGREYLAKMESWMIKTPTGGLVSRRQVPLKLAWAFSIHKSQGLTLDCVEMSLSKVFEAGQAYVALSRAQSLESVRVLDFDPKQVWANPDVLKFYRLFRRSLMDMTMVPLGSKNRKLTDKEKLLKKMKKSLSAKPLVSIS